MRGRKFLDCLTQRVRTPRAQGTDMLTVLCHTDDEDGNRFSDEDIVNHMILLLMAAHDTSTSALTTMAYHLAAHPKWQERCRDKSARLGDELLDLEALEKLETMDLVMNSPAADGTAAAVCHAPDRARHRSCWAITCRPARP